MGGDLARAELRRPRHLVRGPAAVRPHPQVRRQAHPHGRPQRQSNFSGRGISLQAKSGKKEGPGLTIDQREP